MHCDNLSFIVSHLLAHKFSFFLITQCKTNCIESKYIRIGGGTGGMPLETRTWLRAGDHNSAYLSLVIFILRQLPAYFQGVLYFMAPTKITLPQSNLITFLLKGWSDELDITPLCPVMCGDSHVEYSLDVKGPFINNKELFFQ
jgi:hypothetical protein